MNTETLAPNSLEYEEATLGSILINPSLIVTIAAILNPADFFFVKCGWVYEAMLALFGRGDSVDSLTVARELVAAGRLTGPDTSYVVYLSTVTPTHLHGETYARHVERLAVRRRMLAAASDIAKAALQVDEDLDECLAVADNALAAVGRHNTANDPVKLGALAAEYYDYTDQLASHPERANYIPTGYHHLDALTDGGMYKKNVILVAARPGVGKTSLLIGCIVNAARRGFRVGFLSLEMSKQEIMNRIISGITTIDGSKLRRGNLTDAEWGRYTNCLPDVDRLPVWVDDTGGLTLPALNAKVAKMNREHGLDLIVVDYLGLMRQKADSRNAEISIISRGLKELAKAYDVPVLVAAQLNRESTKRSDKRPQLSDLRDSGSLEQDADLIIMLHRDMSHPPADTITPTATEVIIRKQRQGPTGTVELMYQAAYTRYMNKADEAAIPAAIDLTPAEQ